VVGRHFVVDIIAKQNLDGRYWWPNLFKDIHDFYKSCDNGQKIGRLKTKSLVKLVITFPEQPFMRFKFYKSNQTSKKNNKK